MREEAVVRVVKLISFGKFLTTIEETGVSFDEEGNIFKCKEVEEKNDGDKISATIMEELVRNSIEKLIKPFKKSHERGHRCCIRSIPIFIVARGISESFRDTKRLKLVKSYGI